MIKINGDRCVETLGTAIGHVVLNRRRELGLSQEELASRAGLHRTYISEIERRSRNLSVGILVQIAGALEVRPSVLLRQAEDIVANRNE